MVKINGIIMAKKTTDIEFHTKECVDSSMDIANVTFGNIKQNNKIIFFICIYLLVVVL